jgi:hypothetical protein
MTNLYSVQLFIQTTEANDVAIVADRGKVQLLEAVHYNIDIFNSAIWGSCSALVAVGWALDSLLDCVTQELFGSLRTI